MEFLIGDHCSDPECKKLDFLPFKCDACSQVFCKDHFLFEQHHCKKAKDYDKDHQVPICPICNKPVSFKQGDLPDVNMNRHIEQECLVKSKSNNRIYKNKFKMVGCSKKEMIELICEFCNQNHCLKHRLAADHQCPNQGKPVPLGRQTAASSTAANAAMKRLMNNGSNFVQKIGNLMNTPNNSPINSSASNTNANLRNLQGTLNEDQALALAIQKSMNPQSTQSSNSRTIETITLDEDDDLTRAIELSKREYEKSKEKCSVS